MCGAPLSIKHGYVSPSSGRFAVGDVATYHCHGDLNVIGPNKNTCLSGGVWSKESLWSLPVCCKYQHKKSIDDCHD